MKKSIFLVSIGLILGAVASYFFLTQRGSAAFVSKLQNAIRKEIDKTWGEGTCLYVELRPISDNEFTGDLKYTFRTETIHVTVSKGKAKFQYPITAYGNTTLCTGEVKIE